MSEKILIPLSIILASSFIAGSLYFSSQKQEVVVADITSPEQQLTTRKVDPEIDHIAGDADAEIFLIEYSDLECPHCKKYYNDVVQRLQQKYKDNDKVAFVFRHFPLTSKHPSSFEEAVSLECASHIGGKEKFFEFKEKIFDETLSDGKFSSSRLSEIAVLLDIDKSQFNTCLTNQTMINKVKSSYDEALSLGLNSTPSVFLQLKNGVSYELPIEYQVTDNLIKAYLLETN